MSLGAQLRLLHVTNQSLIEYRFFYLNCKNFQSSDIVYCLQMFIVYIVYLKNDDLFQNCLKTSLLKNSIQIFLHLNVIFSFNNIDMLLKKYVISSNFKFVSSKKNYKSHELSKCIHNVFGTPCIFVLSSAKKNVSIHTCSYIIFFVSKQILIQREREQKRVYKGFLKATKKLTI